MPKLHLFLTKARSNHVKAPVAQHYLETFQGNHGPGILLKSLRRKHSFETVFALMFALSRSKHNGKRKKHRETMSLDLAGRIQRSLTHMGRTCEMYSCAAFGRILAALWSHLL